MLRIAPLDLLIPPRRRLEAGAEAADPGAGAASGGRRWAGDLRSGFLPALVRCHHEQVDLDAGWYSAKIEIWSFTGVDGI